MPRRNAAHDSPLIRDRQRSDIDMNKDKVLGKEGPDKTKQSTLGKPSKIPKE